MKTIEVTDEMYGFLMDLSKELNTQDHRGTAMPYIFQVQETNKVPAHEGCGDVVWYSSEHETALRTNEEKVEWLHEYANIKIDENAIELNNILYENGFERFYEQDSHEYSNAFLTSKACDEYIRTNRHKLKEPVNFLNDAHRNPELEKLFEFLCGLTGRIHK
jgi:hypothetical protein